MHDPYLSLGDLFLKAYGICTQHPPHDQINRIQPGEAYVVMRFRTPFRVFTVDGWEDGNPYDCFITQPSFPERHGSVGKTGFANDWILLNGKLVDDAIVLYGIPLNRRFQLDTGAFIVPLLEQIHMETMHGEQFYQDRIKRLVLDLFCLMGRHRVSDSVPYSESVHYSRPQ